MLKFIAVSVSMMMIIILRALKIHLQSLRYYMSLTVSDTKTETTTAPTLRKSRGGGGGFEMGQSKEKYNTYKSDPSQWNSFADFLGINPNFRVRRFVNRDRAYRAACTAAGMGRSMEMVYAYARYVVTEETNKNRFVFTDNNSCRNIFRYNKGNEDENLPAA